MPSLSGRPIQNVEQARVYVWDTGTLAWIPMEPAAAGGGGTQYTEDAAAAANPVGNALNLVRVDTPAATVSTDGDNIAARGTNFGALYTTLLDTSGNPVAVGGGTQYTEDAAAAANPIGTALNLIRADALAGVTSTDGDNVAARGTDKGELYVKHVDAIPVTDNGGTLTVDGTVAVTNAGLTELAAAINASSQLDVNIAASAATVPVSNAGLTELAAAINASSQVDVNIAASGATVPVSNAGLTALNGAISGTEVQVDVLTEVSGSFDHGSNRDVDAAAEQITASSIPAKFGVLVKAARSNTGTIYVGNSDVTADTTDATDGFELAAGESVLVKVSNANLVYVIASTTNQKVFWMAV